MQENMAESVFTVPFWTCVSAAAAALSIIVTILIFFTTHSSATRYQKADFYLKITDRYNSPTMSNALRELVLFHNESRGNFAEIFGAEHARQSELGIKLNISRNIVNQYFKQISDMYGNKLIDERLARMLCDFYGINVYFQIVVPMGLARTDVAHNNHSDVTDVLSKLKRQYGDGKIGGAP